MAGSGAVDAFEEGTSLRTREEALKSNATVVATHPCPTSRDRYPNRRACQRQARERQRPGQGGMSGDARTWLNAMGMQVGRADQVIAKTEVDEPPTRVCGCIRLVGRVGQTCSNERATDGRKTSCREWRCWSVANKARRNSKDWCTYVWVGDLYTYQVPHYVVSNAACYPSPTIQFKLYPAVPLRQAPPCSIISSLDHLLCTTSWLTLLATVSQ